MTTDVYLSLPCLTSPYPCTDGSPVDIEQNTVGILKPKEYSSWLKVLFCGTLGIQI